MLQELAYARYVFMMYLDPIQVVFNLCPQIFVYMYVRSFMVSNMQFLE